MRRLGDAVVGGCGIVSDGLGIALAGGVHGPEVALSAAARYVAPVGLLGGAEELGKKVDHLLLAFVGVDLGGGAGPGVAAIIEEEFEKWGDFGVRKSLGGGVAKEAIASGLGMGEPGEQAAMV